MRFMQSRYADWYAELFEPAAAMPRSCVSPETLDPVLTEPLPSVLPPVVDPPVAAPAPTLSLTDDPAPALPGVAVLGEPTLGEEVRGNALPPDVLAPGLLPCASWLQRSKSPWVGAFALPVCARAPPENASTLAAATIAAAMVIVFTMILPP